MTRSCSGKSSVGDSPVVPTGTRPSMPAAIWYSICARRRDSSTFPLRKGVTIAVMAPRRRSIAAILAWMSARGEILANGLAQSEFERIADEGVTDGNLRDARDLLQEWREIVEIQIVPGVDFQAHFGGTSS